MDGNTEREMSLDEARRIYEQLEQEEAAKEQQLKEELENAKTEEEPVQEAVQTPQNTTVTIDGVTMPLDQLDEYMRNKNEQEEEEEEVLVPNEEEKEQLAQARQNGPTVEVDGISMPLNEYGEYMRRKREQEQQTQQQPTYVAPASAEVPEQEQPVEEQDENREIVRHWDMALNRMQQASLEDLTVTLDSYNGKDVVVVDGTRHHKFNDPVVAYKMNERYKSLTGQDHPRFVSEVPLVIKSLIDDKDQLLGSSYDEEYYQKLYQIMQEKFNIDMSAQQEQPVEEQPEHEEEETDDIKNLRQLCSRVFLHPETASLEDITTALDNYNGKTVGFNEPVQSNVVNERYKELTGHDHPKFMSELPLVIKSLQDKKEALLTLGGFYSEDYFNQLDQILYDKFKIGQPQQAQQAPDQPQQAPDQPQQAQQATQGDNLDEYRTIKTIFKNYADSLEKIAMFVDKDKYDPSVLANLRGRVTMLSDPATRAETFDDMMAYQRAVLSRFEASQKAPMDFLNRYKYALPFDQKKNMSDLLEKYLSCEQDGDKLAAAVDVVNKYKEIERTLKEYGVLKDDGKVNSNLNGRGIKKLVKNTMAEESKIDKLRELTSKYQGLDGDDKQREACLKEINKALKSINSTERTLERLKEKDGTVEVHQRMLTAKRELLKSYIDAETLSYDKPTRVITNKLQNLIIAHEQGNLLNSVDRIAEAEKEFYGRKVATSVFKNKRIKEIADAIAERREFVQSINEIKITSKRDYNKQYAKTLKELRKIDKKIIGRKNTKEVYDRLLAKKGKFQGASQLVLPEELLNYDQSIVARSR